MLDGSRSSDPDDDPLQYLWLLTLNPQPSAVLATGVVAVVQLPVGIHPVLLMVNDGLASATNAITIEVITTGQAVERLIEYVNDRKAPDNVSIIIARHRTAEKRAFDEDKTDPGL